MKEERPFGLYDPYADVPEASKARMNADISMRDKMFIKCIHPHRGVLQEMVNMFIKAVVDECRAKNITNYERINEFIDIVRRRTDSFVVGCGPVQDGQANIGGVHPPGENPSGAEPNSHRQTKGGVGPKNKKGKASKASKV